MATAYGFHSLYNSPSQFGGDSGARRGRKQSTLDRADNALEREKEQEESLSSTRRVGHYLGGVAGGVAGSTFNSSLQPESSAGSSRVRRPRTQGVRTKRCKAVMGGGRKKGRGVTKRRPTKSQKTGKRRPSKKKAKSKARRRGGTRSTTIRVRRKRTSVATRGGRTLLAALNRLCLLSHPKKQRKRAPVHSRWRR